jgi:trehalose synthase-fused probable maltokinase
MVDTAALGETELGEYLARQPWLDTRAGAVLHTRVLDAPLLRSEPPLLALALVDVGFERGTHELYQLLLGFRGPDEERPGAAIAPVDGLVAREALRDPELVRELVTLILRGGSVQADGSTVEFAPAPGSIEIAAVPAELRSHGKARRHTAVVLGERLILKVYRRLEAGINPELEVVRFLTECGFPHIGPLAGSYACSGRFVDATLGIVQQFVPAESDGWGRALGSFAEDPEPFLGDLVRLGEVAAAMHVALASAPGDPAFAPEEPSGESFALLAATLDERIEQLFQSLPGDAALAGIAGRGEELRDRLRLVSRMVDIGPLIRVHGDLSLVKVLWTGSDWVVVDFEGEPGRSLVERRQKHPPLRDVAIMLRSLADAASAAASTGAEAPPAWEGRARDAFLSGYFARIEPTGLVPGGRGGTENLLAVLELDQAVTSLRRALEDSRERVPTAVASLERLLELPLTAVR